MQDILGDDLLQHVKLAIRTPGGTWPGFMEALGIEADTNGWEASSDGRNVDARTTFVKNSLAGEVIILYGPPGHAVHRRY